MIRTAEQRMLALSALGVVIVGVLWVGGWALREATDAGPGALAGLGACLRARGLQVADTTGDPLAESAPGGSLTTTIEGNVVTVSVWDADADAEQTVATYGRLSTEDLTGRALARGSRAVLWETPPTGDQASILYGCVG